MFYSLLLIAAVTSAFQDDWRTIDAFERPNTAYHGVHWESLNPGYWKIEDNALRRRLKNLGNANPSTSYPWHWSTGGKTVEPRTGDRIPDLPMGMIWNRDWQLTGNYKLRATFTIKDPSPQGRGEKNGFLGICFGGESFYESMQFGRNKGQGDGSASWMALWHTDGRFGLYDHGSGNNPLSKQTETDSAVPKVGDTVTIVLEVTGSVSGPAKVIATLVIDGVEKSVTIENVDRAQFTNGYLGLACYGALDFEVNHTEIFAGENKKIPLRINELYVCYPLGITLRQEGEQWKVKFIALFRSPGETVKIRVADSENPSGGWNSIPVAGSAPIVDNDWRRFTSVVDVTLPVNPAEKTLYYTVWKDQINVTVDPRPAPEYEGYLGPKTYVGRLPRLAAPYRVCTLGGHAIHSNGTTLSEVGLYQRNWVHGQPTQNAYKHFEDFDFQIVNWDDDVWYLELLFPPPSTDDAYKIITLTIANPTTRWQMMRHWNVINPGDHDYGMDDVKGPEQILVREHADLGTDPVYMQRNVAINQHLVEGTERWYGTENPKDWHHWKMPNNDFSMVVLESRLWRSSQYVNLWGNEGWGHKRQLYDRRDPTRSLLGEEQFAWLQEVIRTDTSPLILLTGVNCMFPVFTGGIHDPELDDKFGQEDRIAADYAGWVKAGVDRMLKVLGGRPGLLSVYGDIHLAGTVEEKSNRIIESSCGPIGRNYGGRGFKKGFGPDMTDFDGRKVKVHALYCGKAISPSLKKPDESDPPSWNFLEKEFDPNLADPTISLKIRNIIDAPDETPRGGGTIFRPASSTGRIPTCSLPEVKTLPSADINLYHLNGKPVIGTRSLGSGRLQLGGLPDIDPGTMILMNARAGSKVDVQLIKTTPIE
jgi:hypothetical protein